MCYRHIRWFMKLQIICSFIMISINKTICNHLCDDHRRELLFLCTDMDQNPCGFVALWLKCTLTLSILPWMRINKSQKDVFMMCPNWKLDKGGLCLIYSKSGGSGQPTSR